VPKREPWLKWAKSTLRWDQSATAQTLGVGDDVQSLNPTYDWSFVFRPRYYLVSEEQQKLSLRGEIGAAREFTNSDSTTDRGEWTLTDAFLSAYYGRVLYGDEEYETLLSLHAPDLTFPTSKVSASVGKIIGVGGGLALWQTVPIRGTKASSFQNVIFIGTAGYSHTFTEFTEATAADLNLNRMQLNGQSVPTNQLAGLAFAEHQLEFSLSADLAITDRLSWSNQVGWLPTWKYKFDTENNDQLCGVVLTGCADIGRQSDRTNFTVVTTFSSEVSFQVFDEMTVAFGYNNITGQVGPDGQRRNMFYSPDARFYLTAIAHLDEIWKSLSGGATPGTANGRESARRGPGSVH